MEQDFLMDAAREGIPLRLIAFVSGELAGTVVLREQAIHSLPEFGPGLGGLFVAASFRDRGVASALIRAGMDVAREQGHPVIYATTGVAYGRCAPVGPYPPSDPSLRAARSRKCPHPLSI